ncbi:MAG TPA: endolytic transglycosylase MltG [Patescibacteria group bacterium]|nr:endolytic transglycosylase MltG [Patescibacteria group bacterium]
MNRLKLLITVVLALFFIAVVFPFLKQSYIGSIHTGALVAVEIPPNTHADAIPNLLASKGVIASTRGFRWYEFFDREAQTPKAGLYHLQAGMSYHAIVHQLFLGPARTEVQMTIIEGWTVDQETDNLVQTQGIKQTEIVNSIGRSADAAPFDLRWRAKYSFLQNLPARRSLEGYLFPDTYRVWQDELPNGLVTKQLNEFETRYGTASVANGSVAPLKNLDEVIILASIVEKEVRTPDDRRHVAGIFLNRLKKGMALQSDATLTYALGSGARATAADLTSDSPYNTYKRRGLPPSPISNPSASSIDAALNPLKTNDLYFLTDKSGTVLYAATLEEHTKNRQKAGY